MATENTLKLTSPAVDLLAANYTMPASPEDLNTSCLGCILGGGRYKNEENKCKRKDDTAKPALDMTLNIEQMYSRLENDCVNAHACSYLNLKGEYLQYEPTMFMQDKKYRFAYGWNSGVKKFDACTYNIALPT